MDYIEAFQNLKTNQKYSRKSPYKAVLLLTVIKMYENGMLPDNEIKYDGTLTRTFKQVWNNLLPHETKFYSDAYLPYWYLQNESFWHIIPIRGQESVLQLMRDEHIQPSETKLQNCVSYAELDEELYFQMTMPSSRRNLKQALLETYFALSDHETNAILNNEPQNLNDQINVADTFKDVFVDEPKGFSGYDGLTEDVQISLNLEYFTYLKNHRYERDEFKEFFPDVESLYKRIVENPVKKSEVSSSFEFEYSNFLRDLKISLMSEDGAIDFVDSIGHALDVLENESTDDEVPEEIDHHDESLTETVDEPSNDSDVETVYVESPTESYRKRMEYNPRHVYQPIEDSGTYKSDSLPKLPEAAENHKGKLWTADEEATAMDLIGNDFFIENSSSRCCIFNKENEKIYSSSGKLKMFNGKPYRIAYSYSRLTINTLDREYGKFITGDRIVNAGYRSALFLSISEYDYLEAIENIVSDYDGYIVCVLGHWYDCEGNLTDNSGEAQTNTNVIPGSVSG